MLFTKASQRRLNSFQIVAVVGTLILLWKVCYESISWPRSYLIPTELGAGNATLGVCYHIRHTQSHTDDVLVRSYSRCRSK